MLLCLSFELATATWRRASIRDELERESQILTNLLSQRVDQHDAHLTSLAALTQLGEHPDRQLFLEVATAIQRFYPRVAAIDLVELDQAGPENSEVESLEPLMTTRPERSDATLVARHIRDAALESDGELVLLPSPADKQRYLLVKRSPNNEQARHALALEIDMNALLADRSIYWHRSSASLNVSLPDGTTLQTTSSLVASNNESDRTLFDALIISDVLNSRTQPLNLTTRYLVELAELLPVRLSIGGPIFLAILFGIGTGSIRLIQRARRAELDARLSDNEARISHASRVNSLGEMASGIAHELNQPLTAVLGQSQAGLRLLKRPDVELQRVRAVLEANVSQVKRASAILARLRNWSSYTSRTRSVVPVNQVVSNVASLISSEAHRLSIAVDVQLHRENPQIDADFVELEQVVFNLVSNSLDALGAAQPLNQIEGHGHQSSDALEFGRQVRITTELSNGVASIVVSDNGRGISVDIKDRLFEPFATDKPGGMGLGLALCARIVERYDGRIEIIDNAIRGTTAAVRFPALQR